MKVVAAPEAEAFVREHGGRLFVWTDRTRCCGGAMTFLRTAWDQPRRDHDFREFESGGFRLYLDIGRLEAPDELHFAIKGWHRKRVDAFWNGCAFVDEPVGSR